ncbi:MAG: NAD(P)-dependent oxidoreductase, partial [Muribaculaceae bacterium]|nr:NAD(P)-dependent oxidoreductase [Muribaculaceae bacterium]
GILHPGLLGKADDPIAFHVPMSTGLEWVSDDDSGRLLAVLCEDGIPNNFWRNYYNIGGGDSYRMSNYEFMKATLDAVGCPPPEKVFELNWFATGNFHGMYYQDSDTLDKYLHFLSGETFSDYMARLKKGLPFYFRLAPLAPAPIIKMAMGKVADKEILGTRRWIRERNMPRIEAAYGSLEAYSAIPDWSGFRLPPLKEPGHKLDHGYDESKPLSALTYGELRKAALFRGGKLLNESKDENRIGDADKALEWQCSEGHRFRLTPRTVLRGGHWCPECLLQMEDDPKAAKQLARKNRFLSQVVQD